MKFEPKSLNVCFAATSLKLTTILPKRGELMVSIQLCTLIASHKLEWHFNYLPTNASGIFVGYLLGQYENIWVHRHQVAFHNTLSLLSGFDTFRGNSFSPSSETDDDRLRPLPTIRHHLVHASLGFKIL